MANDPSRIVVIGTSAGGLDALNELVSQFKEEWNAAYFIVLHLSRKGISDFLLHRLQRSTKLPCLLAEDNQPIEPNHIYIAVPNLHMLVKKGVVKMGHGPEENRWRPSIDVLFRSAAASYNGNTIGIILTGLLDDGTTGMWAIKRCGGTCIVQDPNEAQYPDMPLSVLNRMEVDFCVSLAEMGAALEEAIHQEIAAPVSIPADVQSEAEIAEKVATGIEHVIPLGNSSVYTCPDCGGILTHVKDEKTNRYRCHTGHVYSEKDLVLKQADNIESTLWVALRMMEERKNLLHKMEGQTRQRGFSRFANEQKHKVSDLQKHIDKLKELLFVTQSEDES